MKKRKLPIPIYIIVLMVILAGIVIYSLLAPAIYQINLSEINLPERMKMPSIFGLSDTGYLFGTDHMGRDLFVRIWYATRTSIMIAFWGLLASMLVGTSLGILGGLCGGWIDDVIVFLINVRVSIPPIIIGIVVASIFGHGESMILILIACIYWTGFARIIRAEVMRVRTESFIECSRAIGASTFRIMYEHILVNIASPLIVTATLNVGGVMLFESSMSFLGLGITPPDTSLGLMISTGRDQMIGHTYLVIFPIIIVVLISMSISLIGDWLRDKLDPKLKNQS